MFLVCSILMGVTLYATPIVPCDVLYAIKNGKEAGCVGIKKGD